jgi:hypothetical protein
LDKNPTGLNTARAYLAGCGTQTAALAFGGPPVTGATEEYDGSTWTANPTGLNTARTYLAGCGTQTCSFSFWWNSTNYSSNRRMDRSRSSGHKNNYNKLIGGKNGT